MDKANLESFLSEVRTMPGFSVVNNATILIETKTGTEYFAHVEPLKDTLRHHKIDVSIDPSKLVLVVFCDAERYMKLAEAAKRYGILVHARNLEGEPELGPERLWY